MDNKFNFFRQRVGIVTILFLGFCNLAWSQVNVAHQNGWFYIEAGTDLNIQGNLSTLEGDTAVVSNLGRIFISDSINSNAENLIFGEFPDTVTAEVILNGTSKQIIDGGYATRFGKLVLNNTYDTIQANQFVDVYGSMKMVNGNMTLKSVDLDFLNSGHLIGEESTKRILTGNYGKIHFRRPLLFGNGYTNIAGLGLDIEIDGNLGTHVDMWRKNVPQVSCANGSIERFFYFNPDKNGWVHSAGIRYLDPVELDGKSENQLVVYLSQSNGVTWVQNGGLVNLDENHSIGNEDNRFIMGSESMITLAEGDCAQGPNIVFDQDTIPLCDGAGTYIFPNGITGNSSEWSTGQNNRDSIFVSTSGVYSVTVTDLQGCVGADSVVVAEGPNPVASFVIETSCENSPNTTLNTSSITDESNLSYTWEFNDPYTPNPDTNFTFNPSFVYSNAGQYIVRLVATSALGCSSEYTDTAFVYPYAKVDFEYMPACVDSVVPLINNTTILPEYPIEFTWNFGNGDFSVDETPMYNFGTEGSKNIQLVAESNGCVSDTTIEIIINPNPVANFEFTGTCPGMESQFTSTSTITQGTLGYQWTFEEGETSYNENPSFAFSTSGEFEVALKVISDQGCTNTLFKNIAIDDFPSPVASIPDSVCVGSEVTFENESDASSSFLWDIQGLAFNPAYEPVVIFETPGLKEVTLTEIKSNGCQGDTTMHIFVKPIAPASFNVTNACQNTEVEIFNTTPLEGTPTFLWDFGNAVESNEKDPLIIYDTPGTFEISLTTNRDGCLSEYTESIEVYENPEVDLGGEILTCGDHYEFDASFNNASYRWNDGSTNPLFTAQFNGVYWVDITSDLGCVYRDSVVLTLNTAVQPSLGNDTTFCDQGIIDAGYPGATYLWSTGSTEQMIEITTSGNYWVQITDQNDCIGSDTIWVDVAGTAKPELGEDLELCEGEYLSLVVEIPFSEVQWSTGDQTASIEPEVSGTYSVLVTSDEGCVTGDTINVLFHELPLVDLGLDGDYCDSAVFVLEGAGFSFSWSTGGTNPEETFTESGTYWVEKTDDLTGCSAVDSVVVEIIYSPVVNLGEDTSLCFGESIILDAGNPGYLYDWNNGVATTAQFEADYSSTFFVEVTSENGCSQTDSINITILDPVLVELGADATICPGGNINIGQSIENSTYKWFHNGIDLNWDSAFYRADLPGAYELEIINEFGCLGMDSVEVIETGDTLKADFLVVTQNILTFDSLIFINLSVGENFQSVWDFNDGTFSVKEDPIHVFTEAGEYGVKLKVSNEFCTDSLMKTLIVLDTLESSPIMPLSPESEFILESGLFPNPNYGTFSVEALLAEEMELKISCHSMQGGFIFSETVLGTEISQTYYLSELNSGTYVIHLQAKDQVVAIRFIKL